MLAVLDGLEYTLNVMQNTASPLRPVSPTQATFAISRNLASRVATLIA